ncbi:MAG: cyclodeaminase/cyclohydrolase family protein [Phycisphaerae bacterium]
MAKTKDMLSMTVREFLDAAAAKTPTPGGGSVAAVVAALAAALGEMALNFTSGKKKYAEHQELYDRIGPRLTRARHMFKALAGDDAAAYEFFRETTAMADSPEKTERMSLALAAAIDVPRELTKVAIAVLEDLKELSGKCNRYLLSDLLAAAALSAVAVRLSDYNVRINARQLPASEGDDLRSSSADDLARAERLRDKIESTAGLD